MEFVVCDYLPPRLFGQRSLFDMSLLLLQDLGLLLPPIPPGHGCLPLAVQGLPFRGRLLPAALPCLPALPSQPSYLGILAATHTHTHLEDTSGLPPLNVVRSLREDMASEQAGTGAVSSCLPGMCFHACRGDISSERGEKGAVSILSEDMFIPFPT